MIKLPKNTERLFWTNHAKEKMKFYNIPESRIKNILNRPSRKEEGIAPKTLAVMQEIKSKTRPTEIWVMYQNNLRSGTDSTQLEKDKKSGVGLLNKSRIKIISAWRYPGISPINKSIFIPEDILVELELNNSETQ